MAKYSRINTVLNGSQKNLRAMNSNRLAEFAAPLQCTDEVKVVSRVPQVSDVGDLGNSVVGVCRGEKRRKGREVPNSEA